MTDYTELQQLISHYAEFHRSKPGSDLAGFGRWLAERLSPSVSVPYVTPPSQVIQGRSDSEAYYTHLPPGPQAIALLDRLARFHRLLFKDALVQLELGSKDELGLLLGVIDHFETKRTDLNQLHLLEATTVTEIIRRLLRDGLVEETPDPDDRRAKRLRPTSRGEQVGHKGVEYLMATCTRMLHMLEPHEVQLLASILYRMNEALTQEHRTGRLRPVELP